MQNRAPDYENEEGGLSAFGLETKRIFKKLLNKLFEGEIEAESIR